MSIQVERAHGLEALGILRSGRVHWNLSPAALYEEALRRGEGILAAEGPLVAKTGQHTGRSPNDKFVVKESSSERHVHWGTVNRPVEEAKFDALHKDMELVGAPLAFIRGPFVAEGFLQGGIGALVAIAALWVGFLVAMAWWGTDLNSLVGGGSVQFLPIRLCLYLIFGGMLVGSIGGLVAAREAA